MPSPAAGELPLFAYDSGSSATASLLLPLPLPLLWLGSWLAGCSLPLSTIAAGTSGAVTMAGLDESGKSRLEVVDVGSKVLLSVCVKAACK